MNINNLISHLTEAVKKAQNGMLQRTIIYEEDNIKGTNEFLFFIKPEITLKDVEIKIMGIEK